MSAYIEYMKLALAAWLTSVKRRNVGTVNEQISPIAIAIRAAVRERDGNILRIVRAAEQFFRHHGHHPDESCCDHCEPLKDAINKALNELEKKS